MISDNDGCGNDMIIYGIAVVIVVTLAVALNIAWRHK
jgi:hypothetical protein